MGCFIISICLGYAPDIGGFARVAGIWAWFAISCNMGNKK
jgi:hypothetical protein